MQNQGENVEDFIIYHYGVTAGMYRVSTRAQSKYFYYPSVCTTNGGHKRHEHSFYNRLVHKRKIPWENFNSNKKQGSEKIYEVPSKYRKLISKK